MTTAPSPRNALEAALVWQMEMGADEAVGEESMRSFGVSNEVFAVPKPRKTDFPPPLHPPSPLPCVEQHKANDILKAAQSFEDIEEALHRVSGFALKDTAKNLVYLDGHRGAEFLLIGEAPGRDEDLEGKPFVGRAGQLLDRMLFEIGLDRRADDPKKSVLITNVIFWRPPGNRKPSDLEVATCLPFVHRTIALHRPRAIVCLGATPTQALLGTPQGILSVRGKWSTLEIDGLTIPVLPTLHPAYLLRQPLQKRLAWRDWLSMYRRFLKPHEI